jgi:glycosyltransferase involved in cell wall biosynthesis
MSQPLSFSVVTPSFNQAAFIGEALRSVRDQGHGNVEHWVIDGASGDGTIDLLRQHADKTAGTQLCWLSAPDSGQSNALNKGFDRVTGDIVGWLNSDDRYRHGCFDCVSKVFRDHPKVDVVYGDYTWMDEAGDIFRIRREIEFSYFILLHHRVPYIASTSTFFRRRIFDEGNRLDENLQWAMDYEFFLRLASRGYRFMHVPRIMADFRFQRDSKTCRGPDKQLEEINDIRQLYSPVLRRPQTPASRHLMRALLRSCAGALRYSEKLLRGYYFDQHRPATLGS